MVNEVRPEVKEEMRQIGILLNDAFPGFGFALFVFDWGGKGFINYISNAQREDMVRALHEFLDNVKKDTN